MLTFILLSRNELKSNHSKPRACHPLLRPAIGVVRNLGATLGTEYEIVLHDVSSGEPFIVEIFNGELIGRTKEAPLTTINVSKELMGARAFYLLMERIRMGPDKPAEKVRINGSLVKRKSVRSLG
jgi:hypothetical protein